MWKKITGRWNLKRSKQRAVNRGALRTRPTVTLVSGGRGEGLKTSNIFLDVAPLMKDYFLTQEVRTAGVESRRGYGRF